MNNKFDSIKWSGSKNLTKATYVSAAMDDNKNCIAVMLGRYEHKNNVYYRTGKLSGGSVSWSGSYSSFANNVDQVSVAMNNHKKYIALLADSGSNNNLYHRVGTLSGNKIKWSASSKFATGRNVSAAMNDQGKCIAVITGNSDTNVYYKVGTLSGNSLKWSSSNKFADGANQASVTMNNHNQCIAVLADNNSNDLYYRTGKLSGNTIQWNTYHKFATGRLASVDMDDDGQCTAVIISKGKKYTYYRTGQLLNHGFIAWSSEKDSFATKSKQASVAVNNDNQCLALIIDNETNGDNKLYYRTGKATYYYNWMEELLSNKADTPLNDINIPGTHDAATYNINENSTFSKYELKAEPEKKIAKSIFDTVKLTVVRNKILGLAKAQSQSILTQLYDGIRYFDLRPGFGHNKNEIWISHSFYSVNIDDVLRDINVFTEKNEQEVIILDCRYLWGETKNDPKLQAKLEAKIKKYLGKKVKINPEKLKPTSTLQDYWKTETRVIVYYPNSGKFSRVENSDTPGKDADSNIKTIDKVLPTLDNKKFRNVQCQITPSYEPSDLMSMVKNSLESYAKNTNKHMIVPFENNWKNQCGAIYTVDFYEYSKFIKTIIESNR